MLDCSSSSSLNLIFNLSSDKGVRLPALPDL